jgi:BirA family biotin operon repressor/biotin-[acetyl-CoA-carboxylase] ligase
LLDKTKIKKLANVKKVQIDIFEQINSTNSYLQTLRKNNKVCVCLAEMQTQGRGRLHRTWHSPFGKNIYFSLLYPVYQDISTLSGLSLVIGLAVCKAIAEAYALPKPILVKWPNDVMVDNKKLAGNLIEIQAETHGFCHVIIGIGINVNIDEGHEEITQPWTSIRKINHLHNDRNILCAKLIDTLLTYIEQFEKYGLCSFLEEWKTRDSLLNKLVRLKSGNREFEGQVLGISEQGHLQLKLSDGTITHFSSGDTTLIKTPSKKHIS